MNSPKPFRLVICGGGASAVLLVHALAKHATAPIDVTIVERRPDAGLGRAYSTRSDVHFLNVCTANISADKEDSGNFLNWLNRGAPEGAAWQADAFAPRSVYGAYLKNLLREASNSPLLHITERHAEVVSVEGSASQWHATLADGEDVAGDAIVIATGNEAPAPIVTPGADAVRPSIINDPWDVEAKAQIAPDDDVLLLGTGLTAVDIVADLVVGGHKGKIIAVSRHALLPATHDVMIPAPAWIEPPFPGPRELLKRVLAKARAAGPHWQAIFDALRPFNQQIWQNWPDAEKRRFLRHAKTYWNTRRHRIPPVTAGRMNAAIARGQLELVKGRLRQLTPLRGGGLRVSTSHAGHSRSFDVRWLVSCTEPNPNPARSTNPLISGLVASGLARPGTLGLGLDVSGDARLVGRDGDLHKGLFAMGPLTIGRFWEVVAIPEIRVQADALAREFAAMAGDLAEAAMTPRSS
ncbi:MAG TPA: FAD/NAD(P)-binding protein [Rhizomicrobium sp.]|jgi:uncharacterized NAD(P)/FAD-binding protein YdhS|nr:FAD/NAD(P)-binding protein [Rhizomicrobium sp.]